MGIGDYEVVEAGEEGRTYNRDTERCNGFDLWRSLWRLVL